MWPTVSPMEIARMWPTLTSGCLWGLTPPWSTPTTIPTYNYCVLTYDQVGGYAPSNIKGDTLLTVPDAVELSIPEITKTTIRLEWTQVSWGSTEADQQAFNSYEVWRDSVRSQGPLPGEEGSTYLKRHSITGDITATTYTDREADLLGGAVGYYIIIVKDTFGQLSYSNEVEGGTIP